MDLELTLAQQQLIALGIIGREAGLVLDALLFFLLSQALLALPGRSSSSMPFCMMATPSLVEISEFTAARQGSRGQHRDTHRRQIGAL
jgi:hypothetical protein